MTHGARRWLMLGLLIVLTGSIAGNARGAGSAEETVDKAIKATGGAEAIAKHKAITWNDKGVYYGMGTALEYEAKFTNERPNRARMEIIGAFISVLDGDKGWVSAQGTVREMTDEEVAVEKEGKRLGSLAALATIKDKGYKLDEADEIKIGGRPAVGVKVSKDGLPDVAMWFDKESHLLVRLQSTVKSREQGKEVKQEITYSDHKEVKGVKLPMKYSITHDGEKFVEGEMRDVEILDKLDDGLFKKP